MKAAWMFIVIGLISICGCSGISEYHKNIKKQIDDTTVSSSYYVTTIVHDEHLFLILNYGPCIIHHPNCPCLNKKAEKEDEINKPPEISIGEIRSILVR